MSDAGSNDGSAGASSVEGGAGGVGGVPHSPMHRTMPVPKKAAAPKAVLDTPRRHATSVAAELEQFAEKNNADVEARLKTMALAAGVDFENDKNVTKWIAENLALVTAEVKSIGRDAAIEEAMETLAGLDDDALKAVMERLAGK